MKNKVLWLAKAILSGVLAMIILNLVACVYRGGLPTIADETMSTSYRYVPNSYYTCMTEGFSFGVYDKNGYNNAYPAQEAIDYLFLGPSHVEAKQVMPTQNMVYDLNDYLNSGGGSGYAYNIGVNAERLPTCVNRLRHAIDTYHPQKAVIFVTSSLNYSETVIQQALGETRIGENNYSSGYGLIGFLKRLPYTRLIAIQRHAMARDMTDDMDDTETSISLSEFEPVSYTERITPLIEKAATDAEGLSVVIVYHPSVSILSDGSMITDGNDEMIQSFRKLCKANQVLFLDMSERFLREYNESYTVPYGFANTSAWSAHLNRYGHEMIAEEIYKLLSEEGLTDSAP